MPPPAVAQRSLALWFPRMATERPGAATRPALLRLARRHAPHVAAEGASGVLVDLRGCTYPFGDEAGLLADVGARCAALGLTVRMGLGDTPGLAWALARHGAGHALAPVSDGPMPPQGVVAPPGTARAALDPLPVAALRLPPEVLALLAGLGLRRIGDLADLPRAAVARRFGPELVLRLDQALGRTAEPLAPTAPARAGPPADPALGALVGTLAARLGDDRVTRLHPADSRIPEKTALVLSAAWSEPWPAPWPAPPAPRPLVLHAPEAIEADPDPMPPATFRWRSQDHALRQAAGPERIAPEWWLDEPGWRTGPRDYWRAETTAGDRLWLYYAHGGAAPGGWFCHGRFA